MPILTHGSVAKAVRFNKERNPSKYCKFGPCLWRLSEGMGEYCKKHAPSSELGDIAALSIDAGCSPEETIALEKQVRDGRANS